MNTEEAYCVNGCGKLAVAEGQMTYLPAGPDDFNVVVELICIDCITDISQISV